jgi:hypothetical protein
VDVPRFALATGGPLSTRIALAGVLVAASAHGALAEDDDQESDEAATPVVVPDFPVDINPCCTTRDTPPCVDDRSEVVGYRQCTRYGSWGTNLLDPDMFVQVGMNMRHFAGSAPMSSARSTAGTEKSPGGGDDALMFDERIGYPLTRGIYMAFDFELGNFNNPDSKHTNERDFVLDGLVSLGARGGLGPFSIGAEVAGGVMQSSFPSQQTESTDGILEARGRAELWLAPWFTVGGAIGASIIDRGDWMAGLYLGVHTWAYAGDRY